MSVITKAGLINAQLDVNTIDDVVNGDSALNGNGIVTTRKGLTIKTLAKVLSELEATEIGGAYQGVIASGQNVGDFVEPGTYAVRSGALGLPTDAPSSGFLLNLPFDATFLSQTFFNFQTDHKPWVRTLRPENGFVGEWRSSYLLLETLIQDTQTELELKIAELAALNTNALIDLNDSLNAKNKSTHITLIGDSITWGLGASDNGPSEPRGHSLTDVRDILTSKSWANKLRKWSGSIACGAQNESSNSAGENVYSRDAFMLPWTLPEFKLLNSTGSEETVTVSPPSEALLKYHMDIAAGQKITFDFFGDKFDIIHANIADNSWTVHVDGLLVHSQQSTNTASWSNVTTIDGLTFENHTITIENTSASTIFRLEAFKFYKTLTFTNNGLIGTNSEQWLPEGGLLSDGVPETTTHLFIQLGTNDRSQAAKSTLPANVVRTSINIRSIVEWLKINRPSMKIILMAPPMALGNSDQYGRPTVYHSSTDDLARESQMLAAELDIAFINNYSVTNQANISGQTFLADDLHLNDLGNQIVFENIVDSITKN